MTQAEAQEHHEIGITAGLSNYYGDLTQKMFPKYGWAPMGGIIYKYSMNPWVSLRFGASYTSLSGADSMSEISVYKARNLDFGTHLFEMHGGLEFNFIPIEAYYFKATPYVFGGISAFYFNPFSKDPNGDKVFLKPLSTEGEGLPMYPDRKPYSNINMAFPFGGGFKFFIGKTFMLTTEVGFRYTNTDYIDDVSKSYVDLDTLKAYKGVLAKQMSYRGNALKDWDHNNPYYGFQRGQSNANDWYYFVNIGLNIYFKAFGNNREYTKTRCPGFYKREIF